MSRFKWILKNANTNAVYQLTHDTKDWEQLTIKRYRSDTYHGIFMEPSQKQFTFLKGQGKEFIDDIFATDDINGNIELICLKAGEVEYFTQLFRAKLNLSSRQATLTTTTVGVEQSGLYQKLLSREEVNVDLEATISIGGNAITAPAAKVIELPGMSIFCESEWKHDVFFSTLLYLPDGVSPAGVPTKNYSALLCPVQRFVKKDFDDVIDATLFHWVDETAYFDWRLLDIPPILNAKKNDFVFADNNISFSVDYSFTGSFVLSTDSLHGGNFGIQTVTLRRMLAYGPDLASATALQLYSQTFSGTPSASIALNFPAADTITIQDGDSVWSFWLVEYTPLKVDGEFDFTALVQATINCENESLKINITSTYEPTSTKAIMIHEAFNQVVDAIADSDGNFRSDYLGRIDSEKRTYPDNGKASFIAQTTGKNIRLIDAKIYNSLKQLFTDANALLNLGLAIVEGKIRVEEKRFFYNRNRKLFTLQNVKNIVTQVDSSRYVNKIDVGYETWNAEFKGGLDDPHAKQEYSTRVNSLKSTYEQISSTIGSSYAIEATRRKNIQVQPSEDWRYDNNNFWLALLSSYAIELASDSFSSPSGMNGVDSAYNLRITPKRMLLAHLNLITSGLQKINGNIAFTKGDGNTALGVAKNDVGAVEDYNGQILNEADSIVWNDANAKNIKPLYLPETYSFSAPITEEQQAVIDADPYGYIEVFESPDSIKRGFILECDYKLKDGMTQFKLIKRYEDA